MVYYWWALLTKTLVLSGTMPGALPAYLPLYDIVLTNIATIELWAAHMLLLYNLSVIHGFAGLNFTARLDGCQ